MSTVDGMLTALNSEGQVLWTHTSNEPLFTSSLSHRKVSSHEMVYALLSHFVCVFFVL